MRKARYKGPNCNLAGVGVVKHNQIINLTEEIAYNVRGNKYFVIQKDESPKGIPEDLIPRKGGRFNLRDVPWKEGKKLFRYLAGCRKPLLVSILTEMEAQGIPLPYATLNQHPDTVLRETVLELARHAGWF